MPPTIEVRHGSLVLNVPCSIFAKFSSEFVYSAENYFLMIQQRYPWLTDNSIEVLKRRAKEEMRRVINDGLRGTKMARILFEEGKHMDAIRHLESHLIRHENDGDAWYFLGEILCRIGRADEGYKLMNHGRSLFRMRTDR